MNSQKASARFISARIKWTPLYKYLDTLFSYNNKFIKAIKAQSVSAERAMYSLLKKCRKLDLPLDVQLDLFEKCVKPILLLSFPILKLLCMYSGVHLIRALIKRALAFCEFVFKSRPSSFYFPVKNPGYCELVIASFCLKRAYLFVPGVLNTQ